MSFNVLTIPVENVDYVTQYWKKLEGSNGCERLAIDILNNVDLLYPDLSKEAAIEKALELYSEIKDELAPYFQRFKTIDQTGLRLKGNSILHDEDCEI